MIKFLWVLAGSAVLFLVLAVTLPPLKMLFLLQKKIPDLPDPTQLVPEKVKELDLDRVTLPQVDKKLLKVEQEYNPYRVS